MVKGLSLGVLSVLLWVPSAQADWKEKALTCAQYLNPLYLRKVQVQASRAKEHAKFLELLRRAEAEQNVRLGEYALAGVVAFYPGELHWRTRGAFRERARVLEHTETDSLYSADANRQALLIERRRALLGISALFREKVPDDTRYWYPGRINETFKIWIADAAVAGVGVPALRLFQILSKYLSIRTEFDPRSGIQTLKRDPGFLAKVGVESSPFIDQVLERMYPPDLMPLLRRQEHTFIGKLFRPLGLSAALFVAGIHPLDHARTYLSQVPVYPLDAYLQDVEHATGMDLAQQRIHLVVDAQFFHQGMAPGHREMLKTDDPTDASKELSHLRSTAVSYRQTRVKSRDELLQAVRTSAPDEVVVILAHGQPGFFALGGDYSRPDVPNREHVAGHRLPEGFDSAVANRVIFISCLFADEGANPAWVKVADALMAEDGVAAASNTIIVTQVEYDPGKVQQANLAQSLNDALGDLERTMLQFTGAYHLHLLGNFLPQKLQQPKEPGVWVYDAAKKELRFMPASRFFEIGLVLQ